MNNVQALTALRDKVKAGQDNSELWRPALSDHGITAMHAYHGSLDAAKALHEAVLPMHEWLICFMGGVYEACVALPSDFGDRETSKADNPARAWLLAILEALIANAMALDATEIGPQA